MVNFTIVFNFSVVNLTVYADASYQSPNILRLLLCVFFFAADSSLILCLLLISLTGLIQKKNWKMLLITTDFNVVL